MKSKMSTMMKKCFIGILSVSIIVGNIELTSFAQENVEDNIGEDNIEDTSDDEYQEDTAGTECQHEHAEECYQRNLICSITDEEHIHDDSCYEIVLCCNYIH